ncbi:MAG: DUF2795 domain-containing protein [Thermoleophilaceae bacterium]
MDDLGGFLGRVEFPSTKEGLIDAAVEAGAPQELLERLQALHHEQYETPGELELELAGGDAR